MDTTVETQDRKMEIASADPWLARPANRWPFSVFFVLVALLVMKPLIIHRLVARAEAYSSYGLYNNAARQCKKAIFLDNSNELAWNVLGSSYKNQGDFDNAVNTYLNAINVKPSNKVAHFRVAMIFALQQRYSRAVPHFEYIRSLGPETREQLDLNSFSYYRSSLEMLSLCYERVGKLNKMQNILDELEKVYPGYKSKVDKLHILERAAETEINN
jgi:tetratricopeptide (TPR) repeat protein